MIIITRKVTKRGGGGGSYESSDIVVIALTIIKLSIVYLYNNDIYIMSQSVMYIL